MASEDSDQVGSGFAPVHRLHNLEQIRQAPRCEVMADRHPLHAGCELLEIHLLRGAERILPEERDHNAQEIGPLVHVESEHVLAMVVMPAVGIDSASSKERLQSVEAGNAASSLCHDELMRQLVSGLVAPSVDAIWLMHHPDGEASFSVYKANNPADRDQSFLLIVRTLHIFTVPSVCTSQRGQ